MNSWNELRDSSPCLDCYNKMLEYGVKNIIFSCDDGSIMKVRLKQFKPKVISLGRQFLNANCQPIYRNRASERRIIYEDVSLSSLSVSESSSIYDESESEGEEDPSSSSSSSTTSRLSNKKNPEDYHNMPKKNKHLTYKYYNKLKKNYENTKKTTQ